MDVSTPVAIDNRPGLAAIAYRVGTHATFKQTLLARLSSAEHRMLGALRTREDEDFTIALLDAWAVACDVSTFYQERIANESYLRTATERRSLLELAALIGYELQPGVAASTWLAFTLEDPPGAPDQATARTVVEAGTRVQSIPGPDEKPQVYESIEEIEARVAWNAIRPRLTRRQPIVADTSKPLYFAGLATGLKAGDGLFLFPDQGTPLFRQVASITLQAAQQRTEVRLEPLSRLEFPIHGIAQGSSLDLVSTKLGVVGGVTSSLMAKGSWASSDLHATAIAGQFVEQHVFQNLFAARPSPPGVLVFRARAAAFGHNAPLWASLPATQRVGEVVQTSTDPAEAEYHAGVFSDRKDSWADTATLDSYADLVGHANCVFLDNTYPAIVKGSRVVLREGKTAVLYTVSDAVEVSQADFGLSAKVTRLRLNSNTSLDSFGIRGTSIYGASEELPLAPVPVEEPVAGTTIELEGWVEGLSVGQSIVVCGELHTMSGVRACEYATLQSVTHDLTPDGCTEVTAGRAYELVRARHRDDLRQRCARHARRIGEGGARQRRCDAGVPEIQAQATAAHLRQGGQRSRCAVDARHSRQRPAVARIADAGRVWSARAHVRLPAGRRRRHRSAVRGRRDGCKAADRSAERARRVSQGHRPGRAGPGRPAQHAADAPARCERRDRTR